MMPSDFAERETRPLRRLLGGPAEPERDYHIDIENLEEPCAVGLPLDEETGCPWFRNASMADVVDELQHALRERLEQEARSVEEEQERRRRRKSADD
jgi:hypothetical protein